MYAFHSGTVPLRCRALAFDSGLPSLEANREYDIDLRQTGQEIRMSVDGVPVIDRVLPQPLTGSQLGLFVWGKAQVDFSQLRIISASPQVFVAMQFGEPFNTLYQEVIYPRAMDLGLNVIRIDEVAGPGIIFEDITRQIAESKIVIAEITAPNQNVFYELGYAHALNKPTILLAQRGRELPLDIRSYRVIFYDDSIGGKPALERDLQETLRGYPPRLLRTTGAIRGHSGFRESQPACAIRRPWDTPA